MTAKVSLENLVRNRDQTKQTFSCHTCNYGLKLSKKKRDVITDSFKKLSPSIETYINESNFEELFPLGKFYTELVKST